MTHRDSEERLERLTHEALRQLRPCSAPASLQARVLREIERRAALPRWRSGIAHWPAAARGLLLAACGLCVPAAWLLGPRLWARLTALLAGSGVAHRFAGVRDTGHSLVSLAELAAHLLRLIPSEWLFGGLIITSAIYAALAAMGYLLLYPSLPHSKAHSA